MIESLVLDLSYLKLDRIYETTFFSQRKTSNKRLITEYGQNQEGNLICIPGSLPDENLTSTTNWSLSRAW